MTLTFHMKGKTETTVEYKDKLPEGMTAEEFKEKYEDILIKKTGYT